MIYKDVVDTMVDDMLEAMEKKNGNICDDSNSICGEEYEIDDNTHSMSDELEQNTRDNIYICISEPTNVAKSLVKGSIIFYLSENG